MTTTTMTTMTTMTTTEPVARPPEPGRLAGPTQRSPGALALDDAASARAWRVIVGALVGLLVGVVLASIVAIAITLVVGGVTERALRNDVELEDEADDLLATVLDVRHYHRNLFFTGPTRAGIEDFEGSLAALHEELDELSVLEILSPDLSQADELREMVEAYEASYGPAIGLYHVDRAAFDAASDHGLEQLAAIQVEAVKLEEHGEELAEAAFQLIEDTTMTATLALVAVLLGVGLAGIALSIAAIRVLRQQRDLYAAQRESAIALAQALRTRTDFIADASHELRTPLTVLRGNAEVGLAAGPSDCGHEQALREIVAESGRMSRLVEDLLFLARYDAGSVPLDVHVVDVEPWLAEVATRGEVLARERGAVLSVEVAASGTASLDAERMQQAVLVLIDNAAKFSPGGGEVRLRARASGDRLAIEVDDRGPGIPEDVRPYIFERFYRADRTRGRRTGGAGLGLSIARAIVDAHGGRLEAHSRPEGGTSMRISLPRFAMAAPRTVAVRPGFTQPAEPA
jgi:two-component system, OmpR family, sensor histidine kinase VicK